MTNNSRTFVLGIDGMPFSFLKETFSKGKMPYLAQMVEKYGMKKINSVYPTISSVAWTSYMTGTNPAGHGIFGFVNRVANPFSVTIPTATDRKADTLWSELSKKGKRVIVVNVPLTYPPEKVNGILVSGFLCTELEKCAYPTSFNAFLKEREYIIDADAWLARDNRKGEFLVQLHRALEKRFSVVFELIDREEWDFFQLHIMETDRLFHFFWEEMKEESEFTDQIEAFFQKLDDFIKKLCSKLSKTDRLLLLSDHGFCAVKSEVQLNRWFQEQGFLKFDGPKKLSDYSSESLCYSLLPGRVFINLKGREQRGSVAKSDYQALREDIKNRLLELKHPQSGEKVIDRVFFREEIYRGPYLEEAADIIAHPVNGYDLKGKIDTENVFENSVLNGMHTYDDAFAIGVGIDIENVKSVEDFKAILTNSN